MFWKDESGVSALIFALALPALAAGVGGAVEISRAAAFKQRLWSAAELSCRHAALNVNTARKDNKNKDYTYMVTDAVQKNFRAKGFDSINSPNPSLTSTNIQINATGNMPLYFSSVLNIPSMSFSLVENCAVTPTGYDPDDKVLLFAESFEKGHSVPANSWTVLQNWNGWKTKDAGVEINGQRELSGNTIRFGDFFAELDSHCYVSGCHSNSTMSYERLLDPGTYEVSYWYIARKRFPEYANQIICSTDAEMTGDARHDKVAWANIEDQTNRIELYVEKANDYNFDRKNMVDVCVAADKWIERKIQFKVKNEATYRISWRAAGREDTYGGLIDYLRICQNACP